MAYLGDLREDRFGPNGEIWEMDNRVEKRYYWNGAYTDLCDMEPEEVMKHFVNVKIVGEESTKITNKISISVSTGSDGKYIIKATASETVASDVTVVGDYTVVDNSGKTVSGSTAITISKGQKEGSGVMGNVDSLRSVKVNVKVGSSESSATGKTYTDDTYDYTVTDYSKSEVTTIPLYWGVYPYKSNIDDVTINDLENKVDNASYSDYPITFVIPKTEDEYESLEEAIQASYRLVLALPENYAERMTIFYVAGVRTDYTEFFKPLETVKDGIKFLVVSAENDTNLTPDTVDVSVPFEITIK